MAGHFNPLQYARQPESVGVPKNQAEVHANTLMQVLDHYAQPDDLKQNVSTAVSAAEVRLHGEITAAESRLAAKIELVRAEIAGAETRLKAEIRRLRFANGVVIALAIAILAQGYIR